MKVSTTLPVVFVTAAALAACSQSSGPTYVPVPVTPSQWTFQHSVGMPPGPTKDGNSWFFDFPSTGSVNYLVKAAPGGGSIVRAAVSIVATNATFNYKLKADNTCDSPARARFYFQRTGDTMSGQGPYEFYRWWAVDAAVVLQSGDANLSSLLVPGKWSSVYGKRGDATAEAEAAFHAAVGSMGVVGFTFGGGCFFGHGVNVPAGTARFYIHSFVVE